MTLRFVERSLHADKSSNNNNGLEQPLSLMSNIRSDHKRQRYEAKQQNLAADQKKMEERNVWVKEHADSVSWVMDKKGTDAQASLLVPYQNLKDGQVGDGFFIAEGTETVRLILQQSILGDAAPVPIDLVSVLVKPSLFFDDPVRLRVDTEAALANNESLKILLASEKMMCEITGFQKSRGCLACGRVPTLHNEAWLYHTFSPSRPRARLLAVDGVSDTANLGSLIRTSSAMGVDAIVLSPHSCDPWYRQSVRVSMGHVCRIPTVRVENLAQTLRKLAITSFAAVVHQESLCLGTMKYDDVPRRWCCVVGNEGNGISKSVADACSHRLTIEMDGGVDSLSLPVATGILLHGLRERESAS